MSVGDSQTGWAGWLSRVEDELEGGTGGAPLERVLDRVIDHARLKPGDTVIDLGAGTGLLTVRAARSVGPSGEVTALDADPACIATLERESVIIAAGNVAPVLGRLESLPFGPGSFDVAVCRSALIYAEDLRCAVRELARVLVPGGRFSVFEPLPAEAGWTGEVSRQFLELELALKESGGARALDRAALRRAFEVEVGPIESLPVRFGLSMKGRDAREIAREYLYDLPGGLGALAVLKGSMEESKMLEIVDGFAIAASDGKIKGMLPCMYLWGTVEI